MKVPSATRASCLFVANKINNLAGTFFLGAKRRSNPFFLGVAAWIASLRSQ
jgi:hypothetical protein